MHGLTMCLMAWTRAMCFFRSRLRATRDAPVPVRHLEPVRRLEPVYRPAVGQYMERNLYAEVWTVPRRARACSPGGRAAPVRRGPRLRAASVCRELSLHHRTP
jgi:hypothetical protein